MPSGTGGSQDQSRIAVSMIKRRGWPAVSHVTPFSFPRVAAGGGGRAVPAVILVASGAQVTPGRRRAPPGAAG